MAFRPVTDGNDAAAIGFMLMAMAPDRALRAPEKEAGRAPSGRPSGGIDGFGFPPARRARQVGRRPPASRSPNMSCLRARFWRAGCPNAANPELNRQHGLLTALNQAWQAGVVPCADTDDTGGHTAAQINP